MPAPTPAEELVIFSNAPDLAPDFHGDSRSTPPSQIWIYAIAFFAVLALAYSLGARAQTRSVKPAVVGPFSGGASTPLAAPLVVHIAGAVAKPGVYKFAFDSRVQDAIAKAGGAQKTADLNAVNLAAYLEDGQKIEVPLKTIVVAPAPQERSTPPLDAAPETPLEFAPADLKSSESVFAPVPELAPRATKPEKSKVKTSEVEKAKPKILPEVPRAKTAQGGDSQNADPKYFEKKPLNLNSATQEQLELLPGIGPSMAQKILAARKQKGGFKSVEELDEIRGIGEKKMEKLRPLVTVN